MSVIERHSRVTLYYRLGLTDDQILEDNFDDSEVRIDLTRTIHKHARALACSLIPQGIILNRPDQLVRRLIG